MTTAWEQKFELLAHPAFRLALVGLAGLGTLAKTCCGWDAEWSGQGMGAHPPQLLVQGEQYISTSTSRLDRDHQK